MVAGHCKVQRWVGSVLEALLAIRNIFGQSDAGAAIEDQESLTLLLRLLKDLLVTVPKSHDHFHIVLEPVNSTSLLQVDHVVNHFSPIHYSILNKI